MKVPSCQHLSTCNTPSRSSSGAWQLCVKGSARAWWAQQAAESVQCRSFTASSFCTVESAKTPCTLLSKLSLALRSV